MRAARRLALLGLATVVLAAGCGYRPTGAMPARTPRLHIAAFTNNTFRPGIHALITAAILRRVQFDRRVAVVEARAAEAVLNGAVLAYENEAVAFERAEIGRRFRVRLLVTATLAEPRGGTARRHELTGEAFYTAGTGVTGTRAAEEDAIQRAANDVAERLVSLLIEDL